MLQELVKEHTLNKVTAWVDVASALGRWWPSPSDCRQRWKLVVHPQLDQAWTEEVGLPPPDAAR